MVLGAVGLSKMANDALQYPCILDNQGVALSAGNYLYMLED